MTVTNKTAIGRLAAPFTVTNGVVTIDAATTSVAGLMAAADKTKLDGIAAGAEVNVQADWNASSGDALILNKPTLLGWIQVSSFTATPASTSTITMTADYTASIKVGMAVKYTISSVVYYGIVTAITSNLLTVAGAPLSDSVTALYYSINPAQVVQKDFGLSGAFAIASSDTLLSTIMKAAVDWNLSEARLVQIRHKVNTDDSGAEQPRVNVAVNGNKVGTSNTNAGVVVAETWSSTVVDINTTNYVVQRDYPLEITSDANGTNDDASDLSLSCIFVIV